MKKKKNENGFLAIEASLILFFLIFFMLFIWNFASLFTAQNAVSHAAMQTAQSIAVDNMSREKFQKNNENLTKALGVFDDLINGLFGEGTVNLGGMVETFDERSDKSSVVEQHFYYFLGGGTEEGEEVARNMGIDPSSIKFTGIAVESQTGIVKFRIEYKVNFMFSVFGIDGMNLEKNVMFRLYGYET